MLKISFGLLGLVAVGEDGDETLHGKKRQLVKLLVNMVMSMSHVWQFARM